jgi:hypothetical protein
MAKFNSESAKAARKKSAGNRQSPEEKSLKHLSQLEASNLWYESAKMSVKDAIAIAQNPDSPLAQAGLAASFLNWRKTGDVNFMKEFLSRMMGKVPDIIHHEDKGKEKEREDLAQLLLDIARKPK